MMNIRTAYTIFIIYFLLQKFKTEVKALILMTLNLILCYEMLIEFLLISLLIN